MLKIRLNRTGARKKPSYRIVVAESTAPRDGKYIEIIGTYDPLTDPATIVLKEDRAKHWLSVGAQPPCPCQRLTRQPGGTLVCPSRTVRKEHVEQRRCGRARRTDHADKALGQIARRGVAGVVHDPRSG